ENFPALRKFKSNSSPFKTANKFADVVVWNFAVDLRGGTNDARSIYCRTFKFSHPRSRPDLQRPLASRNSLVNHHARLLDWLRGHARVDFPRHCPLNRILLHPTA